MSGLKREHASFEPFPLRVLGELKIHIVKEFSAAEVTKFHALNHLTNMKITWGPTPSSTRTRLCTMSVRARYSTASALDWLTFTAPNMSPYLLPLLSGGPHLLAGNFSKPSREKHKARRAFDPEALTAPPRQSLELSA